MIVAVLPARGRIDQTIELIPRLIKTAGLTYSASWVLNIVVDRDEELYQSLRDTAQKYSVRLLKTDTVSGFGYWNCLKLGATCDEVSANADLIANLANDLLPGFNWLQSALDTFRYACGKYQTEEYLVGFNDGIHKGKHAAHFLVSRSMLERWYGSNLFPLMYHHEFGDTEITARAQEEHRFCVAPFSVLYHNHRYTGAANDYVYIEGTANSGLDKALFEKRRETNWS